MWYNSLSPNQWQPARITLSGYPTSHTTSEEYHMELLQDLGMKYPKENSKHKQRYGLFKCICGKDFITQIHDVKSGNTTSCGCYNKSLKIKHGMKKHKLYNVWSNMTRRCSNKKSTGFKNYGARGITVCERWLDIKNFIEDMYPTYKEGMSIDRINNDGNYEPSNCRWATRTIQSRNTRILKITNTSGYRGVTYNKTVGKWNSAIGINSKRKHIGYFNDPKSAAISYDAFIIEHNLEHTRNF